MSKKWAVAIVVLLVVIAVLLFMLLRCCQRGQGPRIVVRDPAVEVLAEGGECPHAPEVDVPLSGAITEIPEYHDCQRFIVKDANGDEVYDSLYAIFASFTLLALTDTIDGYNPTTTSTIAIPAATVVSHGGTYAPLNIEDGFNCLYLWRRGAAWRAWMVNNGSAKPGCESRLVVTPGVELHELKVVAQEAQGFTQGDYPPVARWEWDAADGEQYIGIRCGAAWCEVSADGEASAPPDFALPTFADPPGLTAVATDKPERVHAIRGWHDAQRLAVWRDGRAVPSDVWAAVIPHPNLKAMTMSASFKNDWVHVATIVASGDYNGAVFTLTRGSQNTIWLCYGSADDCDLPAEQLCETDRSTIRWWGKTELGTGSTATIEYRCVDNVGHAPPPEVPATARWRWLARDETTWTRCDDGCCKLQ